MPDSRTHTWKDIPIMPGRVGSVGIDGYITSNYRINALPIYK